MVFPIAQHSATRSNRFANCLIALVASLTLTATHASGWRCVDASGHTYNSSQRVPSDTCQEMSTGAAYEAPPDDPKDPLVAAPVKSAKTPPLKRAIKAKPRRSGASIGMSKEEALASSWGRPESVNRTTNAYGTREQWVYGGGNYLYFENGVLTSIQN
jgi:hypothetical protein